MGITNSINAKPKYHKPPITIQILKKGISTKLTNIITARPTPRSVEPLIMWGFTPLKLIYHHKYMGRGRAFLSLFPNIDLIFQNVIMAKALEEI